jgi:hypothetical protein
MLIAPFQYFPVRLTWRTPANLFFSHPSGWIYKAAKVARQLWARRRVTSMMVS